ncbi:MAG: hypothetical protein ACRDIE_09015, partial [Chloroflexota bacterium]
MRGALKAGGGDTLRAEQDVSSERSDPAAGRVLLLVLLGLIVLVGAPRISVEAPFFGPSALVSSAGLAPVPQDDPNAPPVDMALRRAASMLPASSVCVIARDSWNRDYFRASYILMPRRVWPAGLLLPEPTPTLGMLSAALSTRRADCLLVPPGSAIPN